MNTDLSPADLITDLRLRSATAFILDNPAFNEWPASLSHHHAYAGGLRKHTLEVLDYAIHTAKPFGKRVNMDVLVAACLWHDHLKVAEYAVTEGNVPSRFLPRPNGGFWVKRMDGHCHIADGASAFRHFATYEGVPPETIDAVEHCILSHHGPVKEWGSPVAPETLEAQILHASDMLSAHYGHTK